MAVLMVQFFVASDFFSGAQLSFVTRFSCLMWLPKRCLDVLLLDLSVVASDFSPRVELPVLTPLAHGLPLEVFLVRLPNEAAFL